MSKDKSPDESQNAYVVPIKETKSNILNIVVNYYDEVYYPTVSIVRTIPVKTESKAPSQECPTTLEPIHPKQQPVVKRTEQTHKKSQEPVLATTVEKIATPREKRSRSKSILSKLGTLATATVALIALALVGLKIAGFRTFTVMSGSMEPELPVGALIYVKPTDYKTLKVGDVISYVANNDKTIVTHRIVKIEQDAKDSSILRFQTKGDANSTPDANLVHYKNVLGTPIITLPQIGYFAHNIQQPPGIYITLVVGTLLLAWTFLPGTLEERRKLRETV